MTVGSLLVPGLSCPCRHYHHLKHAAAVSLALALIVLVVVSEIHLKTDTRRLASSLAVQYSNLTSQVLPHCIIAGVRKCGTRALLEFLRGHSHLELAHSEIHFFDLDENYQLGLEWYRHQMPVSELYQLTLEKTPGYFTSVRSPMRVRHMNSSIRLLFIVRDPVTRMVSDYAQLNAVRRKRNLTELPPFEEMAIEANTGRVDRLYRPLQTSLYHVHLSRWLAYFNRSQVHIVDGEALVQDPLPELNKVEQFLGIEHQLTPDMFYYNKTRGFYCQRLPDYGPRCLALSKGRHHPPVKQGILDTLCRFFRPHNQIFFNMTGQHFDWCWPYNLDNGFRHFIYQH